MKHLRVVVAAIAVTSSGCVCFPFATPPLELSAGAAVASADTKVEGAFPLDVNARPFGVVDEMHGRNFDLGVGYRATPTTAGVTHHGPTLALDYLAPITLRSPTDGEADAGLRFVFSTRGQLLVGNQVDDLGFGATFRFTTEWVGFDNGAFDTCAEPDDDLGYQDLDGDGYDDDDSDFSCSFGHSVGEVGVGGFAEVSYLDLGGASLGWFGVGISVRIPASVGIGIASVLD